MDNYLFLKQGFTQNSEVHHKVLDLSLCQISEENIQM
jgi:hypothetical protein